MFVESFDWLLLSKTDKRVDLVMETFTLLGSLYLCQKDTGLAKLEMWAWFNF